MMREIKFRIWQKSPLGNQMTYPDLYWFEEAGIRLWPEDANSSWVGDYEIMQFTGLKDAKGKEIYEGDIVYDREHILSSDKRYFPVTWGIFKGDLDECETWILGNFWEPGLYTHHEDVEIVGNIYENPELIETECSSCLTFPRQPGSTLCSTCQQEQDDELQDHYDSMWGEEKILATDLSEYDEEKP